MYQDIDTIYIIISAVCWFAGAYAISSLKMIKIIEEFNPSLYNSEVFHNNLDRRSGNIFLVSVTVNGIASGIGIYTDPIRFPLIIGLLLWVVLPVHRSINSWIVVYFGQQLRLHNIINKPWIME